MRTPDENVEHFYKWLGEHERPVHRPFAFDAPIPGRNWYSSCSDDLPRVNAEGVCEGCGEKACAVCGYESVGGKCECETP